MVQDLLLSAIVSRHIVEFEYHGHKRTVEPHILGVQNQRAGCLGYQIGGTSSSGGIPQWRRFFLDEILNLTITERTFPGARPNDSGRHSSWDTTIAIVE